MPEVIEVLKYADFLRTKLKGKKITDINILNGRYKTHGPPENLDNLIKALPLKVKSIETKGKFLYMHFENGMYLFSTLGLSGGWAWTKDDDAGDDKIQFGHLLKYIAKDKLDQYHTKALKHLNVEFITTDGTLYFYDVLSYGTLKVVLTEAELNKKLCSIGPDITAETTTYDVFKARLDKAGPEKLIGNVLMNQRLISGIGNYLRADVLWLAKISPHRQMKDISPADVKKIWTFSRMLAWAKYNYKKGVKDGYIEKDHPKTPEDYKREFYVYYQNSDPQGHPVTKEEMYEGSQKRFIYWVSSVQH
jgi:endonuclease-8